MSGSCRSRLSRVVTGDAAGLAVLATASLIRAVSYMPGQVNLDRAPAHWLEGLLPIPAWGVVWLALAVLCAVAIVWPRALPLAVGATVMLHLLWALSFVGIWLIGESTRGYVSALGYGTVAALAIWGFGRAREATIRLEQG